MNVRLDRPLTPEPGWDRSGLPGWAYHSPALLALERQEIFLCHWQIVGHVSDIPEPGQWLAFDMLGERAVVMRGPDGQVRAFHNLCRHRGARVVDGTEGRCKGAIVCPFHGWVYNLDGSLRGPARPESYGAIDRAGLGLKPIETEVFHGFVFIRFAPGPQPAVAEWLAPYAADFAAYGAAAMVADGLGHSAATLAVNWKSVRDVDNEGYHVAMAHPALQDLYGRTYVDHVYAGGLSFSRGDFGDAPGRRWSVQRYLTLARAPDVLPERLARAWTYYGLFPNAVIAFTPESMQFYQEIPLDVGHTRLVGRSYRRADEDRQTRAARYLARRIDRETSVEDRQLSIWSNESMRSSAFDAFYLSDLEFGVRCHHDMLRAQLPVLRQTEAPPEDRLAALNDEMRRRMGAA